MSLGPARGDTYYWNYETVDLAPYLTTGKNTVAALVWNEAQYRPEAQISVRTGFIVQDNTSAEEILNTDNNWKCFRDAGLQPMPGYFFAASKGAGISLGYAESLYEKGNRNDVDGKVFVGRKDSLIANGSGGQSFTTLNFRTYRYIQLLVQTGNDPLMIDDLYGTFTGYPFQRTSVFNTDNTEIPRMLDIGWRMAQLNAWETCTDCLYYEQLQYIGDTRIQAMVSYYNTSDDRLARNALNEMDHSHLPEDVTHSCYPSKGT